MKRVEGFKIYKTYDSFSHIDFKKRKIVSKPMLYLHERKDIFQERISRRSENGTSCSDNDM